MTSNAGAVLAVLLRDLGKVHTSTENIRKNLGLVGGALAALGGVAVLKGLWAVIEAGKDLNRELEKTKQLGGEFATRLPQIRAAAIDTTYKAPTTTGSGNVRLQRELGTVLQHPDSAIEMLPAAAKAASVIHSYTGEDEEGLIQNLIRTIDARGQVFTLGADGKEHVDQAKVMSELNEAAKALTLGSGLLTSEGLRQRAVQAGPAGKLQTPEAFYIAGLESSLNMGASRSGTAEMGLVQQFIGGTMTKKVAEHLTKAGLLDANEWHSGKSAGVVVDPSVAKRFEGMATDPEKYFGTGEGANKIDAYAKEAGISFMSAVLQLFGRQNVSRLISDFKSNAPQYERARELAGFIPGIDDRYNELMAHDLDFNIKAISASIKTFNEVLSEAGTPAVISFLHGLTAAIQALTAAVDAHPGAARALMDTAAALAGLAVLGGVLQVAAFTLGPFVKGIRLLIAAMGAAEATSAAAAAPALAIGIRGVTAALLTGVGITAGVAAIVAGVAALTKLGSDNETPETRRHLDQLRKQRGSGLGPTTLTPQDSMDSGIDDKTGMPFHKSSYIAPPSSAHGAPIQTIVYMDGRKVADIVSGYQTTGFGRPSSGTTRPDLRMTPTSPAQLVSA